MSQKQPTSVSFDHQNFLHLASIQSATLGFHGVIIGKQLAAQYTPGTAICSILVANLILWLIAMVIISMVDSTHTNAIENVKNYLGKTGGKLAAFVLIGAFLNWYAFQINFSLSELGKIPEFNGIVQGDRLVRFGAALGLIAALLSIGGIRLLRKLSIISLPLILIYHLYGIIASEQTILIKGTWGLSVSAILIGIVSNLPGVINFPTFFRHSKSKAHSYFALTALTFLITFFEISTVWTDFSSLAFLPVYIILTLTTCNLLNIYLASACLETIIPKFSESRGFAIIGLLGTLSYTFIQISSPVRIFQALTNSYIVGLGTVLILAFLVKLVIRRKLTSLEKWFNFSAWIFGCIIATLYQAHHPQDDLKTLLAGVNATVFFYLCMIFIEQTAWAARKKWVAT